MNILYVSVHQILEYDEIRILHSLGHSVLPLGTYFRFTPSEYYRPALSFTKKEFDLMNKFDASGCRYAYNAPVTDHLLTAEFVDQFDAIIVMHSTDFIKQHWDVISRRPVIWRTIGVDIEAAEERIAPFRSLGCRIVRYSPVEQLATHYAGHDAVIRFGKSPDDFLPWTGEEPQVVLFSHLIKARFPVEYESVVKTLEGFPHKIGGDGNEDVPSSIGLVSFDEQIHLLKSSRVYLYGVGTYITYTLNFIEAWMSGIPVIVLDGRSAHPPETFRFAEVLSLVEHGRNGFLASSVNEARQFISALLADRQVAHAIGQEGHIAACSLFGAPTIAALWNEFLSTLDN
jgi:hypothetical protein